MKELELMTELLEELVNQFIGLRKEIYILHQIVQDLNLKIATLSNQKYPGSKKSSHSPYIYPTSGSLN